MTYLIIGGFIRVSLPSILNSFILQASLDNTIWVTHGKSPIFDALPTYKVSSFNQEGNKLQRCVDLDLLEEKRISLQLRGEAYNSKTKVAHDKSLVNRPISIGDWILRKIEGTARQIKMNKLTPKWEGPYLVKEEVRQGTFLLMNQKEKMLSNPGMPTIWRDITHRALIGSRSHT